MPKLPFDQSLGTLAACRNPKRPPSASSSLGREKPRCPTIGNHEIRVFWRPNPSTKFVLVDIVLKFLVYIILSTRSSQSLCCFYVNNATMSWKVDRLFSQISQAMVPRCFTYPVLYPDQVLSVLIHRKLPYIAIPSNWRSVVYGHLPYQYESCCGIARWKGSRDIGLLDHRL